MFKLIFMKKIILSSLVILSSISLFAQNIATARNAGIGQTVTVTGVSSNGSELGSIRYIQDGTAAIPCYGSNLSSVLKGDSITATGVLFDFNGLLEISPTNSFTNHGPTTNNIPLNIPITSAGEPLEAQLIRIENVTFVQSGNLAAGNSTIQITDGTNTLDVRINGTTNIDGTPIMAGPVTITGVLGQFNANYQIVPRSTNDIVAYVAPLNEINVKINGATVLNNGSYIIGNTAINTITIENTGVQNLSVTGASLTGINAADYTTNLNTATIPGGANQNYTLNFNPAGPGSRYASISISNSDLDENPYIINFIAVGNDNLATEPTSNPSSLTFSNVQAYTLAGAYNDGVNAEKYIVLWKNGGAVTAVPTDGSSYLRGDIIGDAKVAYIGPGTSFTPRGIIANQSYHFAVFAFNGPAGFENYKTTNATIGNTNSTGLNIGNYYAAINSSAPTFLTSLSNLINPHTFVSYFNYKQTVMNQFEVRDTTNGQSYVICAYSGERKVFNDPFDWTTQGYSREHSFCHSWMPTFPADNPEMMEYCDQHNLYPTNLQNANIPRSNLPLMDITGNVVFTYLDGRVGYNGQQMVYEPKAAQKGNAARAIFYMATCYNGISGNNWKLPVYQDQTSLKNWHFADLPDNYEIARQEYIFSTQGNRNPYVDSVNFACHVSFSNMTYLDVDCNVGIEEKLAMNFSVFPVPSNGKVFAQVNGLNITGYVITDLLGKTVLQNNLVSLPVLELDGSQLKAGKYLMEVSTELGKTNRSFIIE
jgi:endonuclease I/DNA/RNA endonuclease YhcR with UshA esterase domain